MTQPDSLLAERLLAHRFEIAQRLAAHTAPSTRREIDGGPLAAALTAAVIEARADPIFDVSEAGTPEPSTGTATLVAVARHHGTLRARDDGTLDTLLAEYASLRLGVAEALAMEGDAAGDGPAGTASDDRAPPAVPPRLHAAIDRAAIAAATAFDLERHRQREVVRQAQDHAMRGALNAIRLASLVRRQTGADTSGVIERHGLRMQTLLDRGLTADALGGALRPADLPPRDLVHGARDAVSRWNAARADRCAACIADAPCMGRFDLGRLREALTALLDAVEMRAGRIAAVRVAIERDADGAMLLVQAALPSGQPKEAPAPAAEWPLIELLLRQTAAAHRGRLEAIGEPDGPIGYRLMLAVEPPADPAASPGADG